ncbi:MAG: type II CAAX endopeptidase family protein [Carnobacterium inhibens]|uniref:CPBP family intramembrane glutamic endopeptidase n=1 Tax=Carnobacterium inhibens TaxID=147709 RepID=UPI0033151FF4
MLNINKVNLYLIAIVQFILSFVPQMLYYFFLKSNTITLPLISLYTLIILFNLFLSIYLFKKATGRFISIKNIKLKQVLSYIILGFSINTIFGLLTLLFNSNLPENQQAAMAMSNKLPFWLFFLFGVISGPILEELFSRGFLIGVIFKNNQLFGCLFSVILFTLLHRPSNIGQALIYLGPAVSLTAIFYVSKKVEYSIIFHMVINLISIL